MARHADWYFDIVSPYAYLQFATFDRLPGDLQVKIKPVLFAGLLGAWDNMGPAEIPAKRRQTYRYCHWMAAKRGIPFKTPPRHPFNPLAILRLAVVLDGAPDAVGAIFHHVWGTGYDGQDPDSLSALAATLGVDNWQARVNNPEIKQQLRANTEEAVAQGVFGVPSFVIEGEIFWGDDVTDMMLDYLDDPDWIHRGEWARVGELPTAAQRKQIRL